MGCYYYNKYSTNTQFIESIQQMVVVMCQGTVADTFQTLFSPCDNPHKHLMIWKLRLRSKVIVWGHTAGKLPDRDLNPGPSNSKALSFLLFFSGKGRERRETSMWETSICCLLCTQPEPGTNPQPCHMPWKLNPRPFGIRDNAPT